MFHHIRGTLTELNPALAVVETGGLGYAINITLNTFSTLNGKKEVMLYILPVYKEDSQTLFGFSSKSEREVFTKLLSVSGVGGNTARVILSSLSVQETVQAIASDNVALLKSVKGIGAKTAQRIIIDLKDKMAAADIELPPGSASALSAEAVSALEVLGYSPRQTEKVILNIQKQEPDASLEDLIKKALNKL